MSENVGEITKNCGESLTVFLGGAGMMGGYNAEFVDVLTEAGICRSVYGRYNSKIPIVKGITGQGEGLEMYGDAASVIIYNGMPIARDAYEFDEDGHRWLYKMGPDESNWIPLIEDPRLFRIATRGDYSLPSLGVANQIPKKEDKFNFIGYSWGVIIAALSARYHALAGHEVDTLALIGAPVEQSLLDWVHSMPNIKNVIVINLVEHSDPIYAGMSDSALIASTATLASQMKSSAESGDYQGHFYYSGDGTQISVQRKQELVVRLIERGLE